MPPITRAASLHNASSLTSPAQSFLSLPPEIRRRIYTFYFVMSRLVQDRHDPVALSSPMSARMRLRASEKDDRRAYDFFGSEAMTRLLRTCKTICAEATDILYSTLTLEFLNFDIQSFYVDGVLPRLGPHQRALTISIRIAIVAEKSSPPGQAPGVERVIELLPNVRHVSFILVVDNLTRDRQTIDDMVVCIMELFRNFSRAKTCRIEHLMDWKEAEWPAASHSVLPEAAREELHSRLDKHNAALAKTDDGLLLEAQPATASAPSNSINSTFRWN